MSDSWPPVLPCTRRGLAGSYSSVPFSSSHLGPFFPTICYFSWKSHGMTSGLLCPVCNRSGCMENLRISATIDLIPWETRALTCLPFPILLCFSLRPLPVLQSTMIGLLVPPSAIQEEGDASLPIMPSTHIPQRKSWKISLPLGKQT